MRLFSLSRVFFQITLKVGVLGYSEEVGTVLISGLTHHGGEVAGGIGQQHVRVVVLRHLATAHHQHPVRVHDSVESVSYRQHGARYELTPYRLLDEVVRPAIQPGGKLLAHC